MLRYPDMPLAYLRKVPTRQYARWSVLACLLGFTLDKVSFAAVDEWKVRLATFESVGMTLFFIGYTVLWMLLPLSLFRPDDRFYVGDDTRLRARRCAEIAALLLAVHVLVVIEALREFA